MKIHEYQAKELFKKYGIPVPQGKVAFSVEEAVSAAKEIAGQDGTAVVKAQIHAGGRWKAGGVKVVKGLEEVEKTARELLGKKLVTHQTGPEGKEVKRLLIEEACQIEKEYYLGLVLDRETAQIALMASKEGGVEIEKVAAKSPEKIIKIQINPNLGLQSYQIRQIIFGLELPKSAHKDAQKILKGCSELFLKEDASLVEINPLVLTGDGHLLALDAKINFDDNAAFRHPEWNELRDPNEEDPREARAAQYGLSYIKLNGNIGCLVNGAGLAMATMDIIKYYGGEPANFLDVGGGASEEAVTEGFKLILSDPNVKGILVNIFGGIMKCDIIASAVIKAAKEVGINVPLVVRLEGTNVEKGKALLKESDLNIIPAEDMSDAAKKIVEAAKNL